jgi:opacity protein-like surface antigen
MKKYLIGLAMAFAAAGASADSVNIEYDFEDYVDQGFYTNDSNAMKVGASFDVIEGMTFDMSLRGRFENGTSDIGQRLETGFTAEPFNGYFVRLGVGQEFTENDNFSFYSVQPGFEHQITSKVKGIVRYRYQNAFDTDIAFETHAARGDLEYSFNENNVVAVGYDRVFNDLEANQFRINYSRRF